jgi:hypothetical protein
MPILVDIDHQGARSTLLVTPLERLRPRQARRVAVDAQGRPCRAVWQTWDGLALPPGGVAQGYEGPDGGTVPRADVVATDAAGQPLRVLPATPQRPQRLEGPVPVDELLAHVVTKVYGVTAERLDPALRHALQQGDIYRVPFRPRAGMSDVPAFLLANAAGLFLLQTASCRLEWITRAQVVAADAEDEEELDEDAWVDDGWALDDLRVDEEERV